MQNIRHTSGINGSSNNDTMTRCPLCGNKFDADQNMSCSSCPLGQGCNFVCCPNCGYQWPEKSGLVEFFRRLWSKRESQS